MHLIENLKGSFMCFI